MTTLIRGSWVVAFDGEKHRLIKDGEVAYADDRVTYVGKNYQGTPDEVIEAKGRLISPGFINIHAVSNLCITHFRIDGAGTGGRGLPDKEQLMKNLQNPSPYFSGKDLETSSLFSFVELLKGGSTTIVEITAFGTTGMQPPREQAEILSKTASELGARAYISHPYTDAKKFRNERGETEYYFDESLGLKALDDAVDFCKKHEKTHDDRIRTMLFPYMFDACSSGLLAETRMKADELEDRKSVV